MSYISRLLRPGETRATLKDADGWLYDWLVGGGPSAAGETVGVNTAQAVASYWAAKRNIAEDIGKVPFPLYRRLTDGGKERATENSTYEIIHDFPNDEISSMGWRELLVSHAIDYGNAYNRIVRNRSNGKPLGVVPLDPSKMIVTRLEDGALDYAYTEDNAETVHYDKDEIFHVRGLGFDGIVGYSIVTLAKETLGTIIAATKADGAIFGNGSMPGGILSYPQTLKPEAAKRLRESWEAVYGGAKNKGKTALLEDGVTFTPTQMTNKDAQHIELELFMLRVMARWLRIPPHKVQDLEFATFSNITEQAIEYVGDTLQPWFTRILNSVAVSRNSQIGSQPSPGAHSIRRSAGASRRTSSR